MWAQPIEKFLKSAAEIKLVALQLWYFNIDGIKASIDIEWLLTFGISWF